MSKNILKKIDHIGIAVDNLAAVEETLKQAFDLSPVLSETISEQKVEVLAYHVGESTIEYLQPTSPDSPIARYLAKKGNGLHHIAYRVENLSKTLAQLKQRGFRLIDSQPRYGAEGKKIAFVHPAATNGILLELCEVPNSGSD